MRPRMPCSPRNSKRRDDGPVQIGERRRAEGGHPGLASMPFRTVAQDLVFFLSAENAPQLARRHQGPDVLFEVLAEALSFPWLSRTGLETDTAFQQRPPDGFGFGFMS